MSALPPLGDLDVFRDTRLALHAVAEQVLAAARYRATGRIGLRAIDGGFGTPPYDWNGREEELRVVGGELIVRRDHETTTTPLTTLAAAGAAAGIGPNPPSNVYTPTTDHSADAALAIDPAAASALGAWFGVVWVALEELRNRSGAGDEPSEVQLWPEHFDAAMETGNESRGARGTYGASPGDGPHAEPYLYVELWSDVAPDEFWNDHAFKGASKSYSEVVAEGDVDAAARGFFAQARELLSRQ